MTEERTFQIQLEGLIQLLAQNLYAEPDVFLREMIQNAHDSIMRRAALAGEHEEPGPPAPRIHVVIDSAERQIQIHDNGLGLTDNEIDEYLSTIGKSGTDVLRQRILEGDQNRTVELIGQFGIGLLSAFIVADRVTIVTKAPGQDALRWESGGGGTYTVSPDERQQVGTTVTLHLNSEHARYLERARIESIIRTYADFIGMPVFVNGDADPVNAVVAPWHRHYPSESDRTAAYVDFWQRRFRGETALYVFAADESLEWPDVSKPDGKATGRVRGVLAISDRHTPDVNARGTVDIYVNRMFIGAANRDVLPPWAKFIQGVVECNELTPNAARDNVVRNAALAAVQRTLGDLIVSELTKLSQASKRRFVDIMRWHSYRILAMSVQDQYEDFFRAVADLMPLESNQGPITVAEYLKDAPTRSDGARLVHYITEPGSANQYFLLAGARSIRVLDCSEPFAERFLKRYARTWPQRIHLTRLGVANSEAIFEPLTDDEAEHFAELEQVYAMVFPDRRYTARVSRFRPAEVPAVLTETRDSKNRREMERVAGDLAMPVYLRDAVRDFLGQEIEPLTLHLNADNPTIQKLAARPDLRDEVSRQALISLYNNALMLLAQSLPESSVQTIFTQHNQVIQLMLSLAEDREKSEREAAALRSERDELSAGSSHDSGQDAYVSCFVAMPFKDPRAIEIYEAIRSVLEDQPYFWRVVRADDNVEFPELWSNLKAKLLRAHFYVAILTGDVNPNVMIEIGRMVALERSLLILRDVTAPDPPENLKGLLYEELQASGDMLRVEVGEALSRQQALQSLKGRDRFLSETVLTRYASLGEQVSRKISRRYPAWREFLDADSSAVAAEIAIQRHLVESVKETLRALLSSEA